MIARICFVFIVYWLSGNTNAAELQSRKISGIYSNLYFNQEGGDLLGLELLILPSGRGSELAYSAVVQIADGGAPYSVIVPLHVVGNQIEFTIPSGGSYADEHFIDIFKDVELIVRWSNGTEEKLKKGKSYWQ